MIDYYEPEIVTAQDYYPFGMVSRVALPNNDVPYKFGFNGQMVNNDVKGGLGNSYTAQFWEYDSRIGRRWNLDPRPMVGVSQYSAFSNNPIFNMDPLGDTLDIPWSQNAAKHADSKDDLKSILKPGNQKYLNFDKDGRVTFNKQLIKEDGAIANLQLDPGYNLLRNMISSTDTYFYAASGETSERTKDLSIPNAPISQVSRTSLYLTYNHGSTINGPATSVTRNLNGVMSTINDINLVISNLSVTIKGTEAVESNNFQHLPGARQIYSPFGFYKGLVSIAPGEFYNMAGGTKVVVSRASMVFHELYENYLRTTGGMQYMPPAAPGAPLQGAHMGAVDAAKVKGFNNYGNQKVGEPSDYFKVK